MRSPKQSHAHPLLTHMCMLSHTLICSHNHPSFTQVSSHAHSYTQLGTLACIPCDVLFHAWATLHACGLTSASLQPSLALRGCPLPLPLFPPPGPRLALAGLWCPSLHWEGDSLPCAPHNSHDHAAGSSTALQPWAWGALSWPSGVQAPRLRAAFNQLGRIPQTGSAGQLLTMTFLGAVQAQHTACNLMPAEDH